MYVYVLLNSCCNVDVRTSDSPSDEQAVLDAFKYGLEAINGSIDFDSIEIWDPSNTLIVTLNF